MKNLIAIFTILTLAASTSFASSTPVTVEMVTIESLKIFTSAEFDAVNENLTFTTVSDIAVIQIFTADGELEFQLPVMSDNVKLNKNLFEKGDYKLGFILKGDSQVHMTQVSVK